MIDFNGIPFRPVATRKLDCQYGKHYFKKRERHSQRLCLKSTRKFGCPAHITVKEYCLYPDYQLSSADRNDVKVSELRAVKQAKIQEVVGALQAPGFHLERRPGITFHCQPMLPMRRLTSRVKLPG